MLTYKDSDGVVRIEGCDEGNMEEMIRRSVDRLYEYEKLGLTPDGVRRALRELRHLKKEAKAEGSDAKTDCEAVIEAFNSICVDLPKVKLLSDARRQAIGTADTRLRRVGMTWDEFFRKVADSSFLCGAWKGCGFDWIVKPANLQKIVEGNYDNRRGTKAKAAGSFDTGEFFEASMRRSYGEL